MKPLLPFIGGTLTLFLTVGCTDNKPVITSKQIAINPVAIQQQVAGNRVELQDFVRVQQETLSTGNSISNGPERMFSVNSNLDTKSNDLLASYLPAIETFEIDPSNEVIITTKDNVQLHFEALSFVDETNTPITAPVQVGVQTFDSYLEFAAANLTTQTIDGKILETGGMFHITATSNEHEVFLDANKPYELAIPIQNNQDMTDMHTYYGEQVDGQIKWFDSQTDKKQPIISKQKKVGELNRKFYLEIANRDYPKAFNLFSEKFKAANDNWSDWLQEQDISGTKLESYLSESKQAITIKIKLGEKGDFIYLYDERLVPKDAAVELATIIEKCPKIAFDSLDPNSGHSFELALFGTAECKSRTYIDKKIDYYQQGNKDDLMNNESTETVNAIILKVNKLGYINCDHSRIGRDKLNILLPIAYVVKRVWLIFKDQRVSLEGKIAENKVSFINLPKSNDVYIVALGEDGQGAKMTKLKVKLGQHVGISKMYSFTFDDLVKAFE